MGPGFEILARTPVLQLPLNYPPPRERERETDRQRERENLVDGSRYCGLGAV